MTVYSFMDFLQSKSINEANEFANVPAVKNFKKHIMRQLRDMFFAQITDRTDPKVKKMLNDPKQVLDFFALELAEYSRGELTDDQARKAIAKDVFSKNFIETAGLDSNKVKNFVKTLK